jgi:hypothetical protein
MGSTAVAQQQDASARLRTAPNQPIPLTYNMRTKTLTADKGAGAFFGPEVLFANTCPSGFFIGLSPGDAVSDSGEIPAPNDGILAAAGGGGCATIYTVNGFEIAYCSNQAANDLVVAFGSLYDPCTDLNGITGPGFLITGLPGSNTGGAICYGLTIDLMGTSLEFTLVGSGDGTWNGDDALDSFGYSYEFTNLTGTLVGPIIAGGPVFLGTGCDFAVGTVFEVQDPTGTSPDGTGYFSTDAFGLNQVGAFAGCFFFGGWPANIWSGFHMRVYTEDAGCTGGGPVAPICGGSGDYPSNNAMVCPCGNVSSNGANEGCVNSSTTTGGSLTGAGSVSVATDDLQLNAAHPAGNGGLLLCNTSIFATGAAVFDGLACVGGGPRALPGADNGGGDDQVATDGVRNLGSTTPGGGVLGQVNAVFPGFFAPATTYYLQYWYRDVLCGPPPAPCVTPCTTPRPAAANFTNAVSFTAM